MAMVKVRPDNTIRKARDTETLNDGSRVSLSSLSSWTEAELGVEKLYRVADPVAPAGQVITDVAYQLQNGVPIAVPTLVPEAKIVSASEFRALFTNPELQAVTAASLTDATIRLFMDDALALRSLNLASQRVTNGLTYLVNKGLLTVQRATQIGNRVDPP